MNNNIERLKKLELLLIPEGLELLEKHKGQPDEEVYKLRVQELQLESVERYRDLFAQLAEPTYLEGDTPMEVDY